MERLKMVTLKNFVKRIANAVKETPDLQVLGNVNAINLKLLLQLIKPWDEEMDLDELKCHLSSLIASQLMRAYIRIDDIMVLF